MWGPTASSSVLIGTAVQTSPPRLCVGAGHLAAYRHQRFNPVRSSLDGSVAAGAIRKWGRTARPGGCGSPRNVPGPTLCERSVVCRTRTCVPRKAAAGAERADLSRGHAFLPGQVGRQLAAGTRRPVPAHKSVAVAVLETTTRPSFRGDLVRAHVGRGT